VENLEKSDRATLLQLVTSDSFRQGVTALPRTFGCCDSPDVGIWFEKNSTEPHSPTAVLDEFERLDESVRTFLVLRDRLGKKYFGRRYWPVADRASN
jgi:hypothetical protein